MASEMPNCTDRRGGIVRRKDDYSEDDPSLEEVLAVFDTDELYLKKNYKGYYALRWDDGNRGRDDIVWGHDTHHSTFPDWAKVLFEEMGVEVR